MDSSDDYLFDLTYSSWATTEDRSIGKDQFGRLDAQDLPDRWDDVSDDQQGACATDTSYVAYSPWATTEDRSIGKDQFGRLDAQDLPDRWDDVSGDQQGACATDTSIAKGPTQPGNHDAKLSRPRRRLQDLSLSSDDCDVTLLTSTSSVKAHKFVLVEYSGFFKTLFPTLPSEDSKYVVSFKDKPYITTTGISAILEYLYGGSLRLTEDNVVDIMEIARHFLMLTVTESCTKFVEEFRISADNYAWYIDTARKFGLDVDITRLAEDIEDNIITLDNCISTFNLAMANKWDRVITKVVPFIARELEKLSFSQEILKTMTAEMLLDMVKVRQGIFTDMALIEFIVKWVGVSPAKRLPAMSDLTQETDFRFFDVDSLNAIAILPFIRENEVTKREIPKAKRYLTPIRQDGMNEDTYWVAIADEKIKFYNITNRSIATRSDVLVTSRKQKTIDLSFSSVISVGDVLFILSRPDEHKECPCYSYNPSRRVWKELAPLQGNRTGYKLVCLEGEIYALGGVENGEPTDRVDIYNFSGDEWKEGIRLPRPISCIEAAVLHSSIYAYALKYVKHHEYRVPTAVMIEYNLDRSDWMSRRFGNYSRSDREELGHLLSSEDMLYHIYPIPDGRIVVKRYDQALNECTKSIVKHFFEYFGIEYGLSRMGTIYLIATSKVESNTKALCSLFRLDEVAKRIFLVSKDIKIGDVEGPGALMSRIGLFAEDMQANMIVINTGNFLSILNVALGNDWNEMITRVFAYMVRNIPSDAASHQELLETMTTEALFRLIDADRHGVFTDMALIDFIALWVGINPNDRLPMLPQLIKKINLLCFEAEDLDEIRNLPFIRDDKKAKKMISRAKKHITALKEKDIDYELYFFTLLDENMRYYCTSDQSAVTIPGVLVIPSCRREKWDINLRGSSIISLCDNYSDCLFILGRPGERRESPCYIYSPDRDVWSELSPLQGNREGYALVCLEDEVFVIGGSEDGELTTRVDVYNFRRDDWMVGNPLPYPCSPPKVAVLQNRIYVGSGVQNTIIRYHPKAVCTLQLKGLGGSRRTSHGLGHLLSGLNTLYHFYRMPDGSHIAEHFVAELWDVSKVKTSFISVPFKDFSIEYGLSRKGIIYLVASHVKDNARVYSLFSFDEAFGCIFLLREDVEIGSRVGAIMRIPIKIKKATK